MKPPITYIKIDKGRGVRPIEARLGDIFLPYTMFRPINHMEMEGLSTLALLTTALSKNEIFFTLLGMDKLKHNVSKRTDKSVVILNARGKETEISDELIVRMFKEFARARISDIIGGIPIYLRTILANRETLRDVHTRKLDDRLINMREWPDKALVAWAIRHMNVPPQFVPGVEHIGDRYSMINNMIKMSVSRSRVDSKEATEKVVIEKVQPAMDDELLWDDMPNYVIYNSGHTQPVIADAEHNNSNNNSNTDPALEEYHYDCPSFAIEPDPLEPPEPSRDYRLRHMEKATMSRLRGPENGTYELSSDFPYYMGKHVIKKEIREIDVQEIGESEAKKIKTVHTIVVENGVITQHIEEANAEDENDPGE